MCITIKFIQSCPLAFFLLPLPFFQNAGRLYQACFNPSGLTVGSSEVMLTTLLCCSCVLLSDSNVDWAVWVWSSSPSCFEQPAASHSMRNLLHFSIRYFLKCRTVKNLLLWLCSLQLIISCWVSNFLYCKRGCGLYLPVNVSVYS